MMAAPRAPISFIPDSACPECGGRGIYVNNHTRMLHEWYCKFALNLARIRQSVLCIPGDSWRHVS